LSFEFKGIEFRNRKLKRNEGEEPVTWLAFRMCHGDDQDILRLNREDDRIRELLEKTTPEPGGERLSHSVRPERSNRTHVSEPRWQFA
jgi:hypothetical protein